MDKPRGRAPPNHNENRRSRSRERNDPSSDSRNNGYYQRNDQRNDSRNSSYQERDRSNIRDSRDDLSRNDRSGYDRGGSDRRSYGGGSDRSSYGGHGNNRGGYGGNNDRGYGGNGSNRGGYAGSERGGYGGNNDRGYGGNGSNRGGYEGSDRGGYGGNQGGYSGDRNSNRGNGSDRGGFRGGRGGGSFRGGRAGGYDGGRQIEPPRTENENLDVVTNYFEVSPPSKIELFQYHASFNPPIESNYLKNALLKQHYVTVFERRGTVFDGEIIFTTTLLPNQITNLTSTRRIDNQQINITVTYTKKVESLREITGILNRFLRNCLEKCDFKQLGKVKAYFDYRNLTSLSKYNINIASGYKATIASYESNRTLLNAEVTHKILNNKTVLDQLDEMFGNGDDDSKQRCVEFFVGQTVITTYNNLTYKIDDIAWESKPTDKFSTKTEEQITFIEYYSRRYGIQIRTKDQPMLINRPKLTSRQRAQGLLPGGLPPIYLVPELCMLTGNVVIKQFSTDFHMKKDLDSITKVNPQRRYNDLIAFMAKIKNQERATEDLQNWNMDFSDEPVSAQAVRLKTVPITYADNNRILETDAGWQKSLQNGRHLHCIRLTDWIIIHMPRDENKAKHLRDALMDLSRPMGLTFESPILIRLPDARGSAGGLFVNAIKNTLSNNGSSKNRPQMIVCLIPGQEKDVYDAIKKTCCKDYGIPSQVVTSRIIDPNNSKTRSVVTKVAIQMNCKLGGEVWGVDLPGSGIMVIGMDFYKDSSQKNRSVAAFVASMNGDKNCTKYYSRCQMQERGFEFRSCLETFMYDALLQYHRLNGQYPKRIFVYRDGTSDDQFDMVSQFEIPQLKNAFSKIENYTPFLTVIIVRKRSNARFFYRKVDFQNIPIGSVVDNTVVKDAGNEFYLISQSTQHGTVSPTHYNMIMNENNLNPLNIQMLTYRLTHLYYNWPGQIRVPAPCQYAYKLAHLAGESLHNEHSPELDNKLFYL